MSTPPQSPAERSPAAMAVGNAVYAVCVCTFLQVLCGWAIDWVNGLVGNPPVHKAPTWIGTAIVAGQTGWPVLVLAMLCGLFGRNLNGLTPTLIATHFLGLISPVAGLVVGVVLAFAQPSDDE